METGRSRGRLGTRNSQLPVDDPQTPKEEEKRSRGWQNNPSFLGEGMFQATRRDFRPWMETLDDNDNPAAVLLKELYLIHW